MSSWYSYCCCFYRTICISMLILFLIFNVYTYLSKNSFYTYTFFHLLFWTKFVILNNLIKERHEWSIKHNFFLSLFVSSLIKTRVIGFNRKTCVVVLHFIWTPLKHVKCLSHTCFESNFRFPHSFRLIFYDENPGISWWDRSLELGKVLCIKP